MFFSSPSPTLIRLYAVAWTLGYWALYFFFRDFFPEKALADAREIQDIALGLKEGGIGAYAVTAAIYAMLPLSFTHILVGLFDGWVLYLAASSARTFRGMAILIPILLPFVFFNLQAPTKETIILAMSLIIVRIIGRARKEWWPLLAIVALYGLYGFFLRGYYLIILAAFLAFIAVVKTPPAMRGLYLLAGLAMLLLLPDNVFSALQGTRDEVNFWAVTGGAGNAIRTYFFNPFTPDSLGRFLGNYGYAFTVLNFPFLKHLTSKEVLMFLNVLFYGWLTIGGIARLRGSLRLLPLLFAAHVSVLLLFEPDFGSYFRHFSSCLLYLLPVFLVYEIRYVRFLERKSLKERQVTAPAGTGSGEKAL